MSLAFLSVIWPASNINCSVKKERGKNPLVSVQNKLPKSVPAHAQRLPSFPTYNLKPCMNVFLIARLLTSDYGAGVKFYKQGFFIQSVSMKEHGQ
jgi:hypothetical protein